MRIAFAGVGQAADEVRKLTESAGIADRVKFLGLRKDIPLLLAAADVTALPSQREGLPRAVMESMAIGTPVIGADIRGIRDLLSDGRGTLVPVGDVSMLTEALKKHKTKTPEIETMIQKAKASSESFDVEKIIAQYEDIYDRLQGAQQ